MWYNPYYLAIHNGAAIAFRNANSPLLCIIFFICLLAMVGGYTPVHSVVTRWLHNALRYILDLPLEIMTAIVLDKTVEVPHALEGAGPVPAATDHQRY